MDYGNLHDCLLVMIENLEKEQDRLKQVAISQRGLSSDHWGLVYGITMQILSAAAATKALAELCRRNYGGQK